MTADLELTEPTLFSLQPCGFVLGSEQTSETEPFCL